MNVVSVAVIGAGLAGLACARRLAEAGVHARVFEAQRAPGGRLATRRFATASFDHGAQFLTAVDAGFIRVLEAAEAAGAAARWQPHWPDREPPGDLWVGVPAMNSLPRFLAQDLDVEYGARIVRIEHGRRGWALLDDRGLAHTDFTAVALALPAPAAAALAGPRTPAAARARAVPMAPCWAVLVAFDAALPGVPDAGCVRDGILAWYARNGSKPGREARDAFVLHAAADWSRAAFDQPAHTVQGALLDSLLRARRAGAAAHDGRGCPPLALRTRRSRRSARTASTTRNPASDSAVTGASTRAQKRHGSRAVRSARRSRRRGR